MFCSKCGKEISDNAGFCPECGADLSLGKQVKDGANDMFHTFENNMGSAIKDVQKSINNAGAPYVGERLTDDRGLLVYILLSIITCGIYSYYFLYKMAHDINIACEGDGEETAGLVAFILLSFVTCGIYAWFWYYKLGNRLASNASRYHLSFQENGTTVLLWLIFGSFLCGIGGFVAMYILIKNSNEICGAYNRSHGL